MSVASPSAVEQDRLLSAPVRWPRPEALDAPLTTLAGVGPKLTEAAAEAGIENLGDLLLRVPHSYRDRSALSGIGAADAGDGRG